MRIQAFVAETLALTTTAIAVDAAFGLYLVADLSVAHGWTTVGRGSKTAWAVVAAD